jgi:hypothetical protein
MPFLETTMRRIVTAALLAIAPMMPLSPALAQSAADQARFDNAQRRFDEAQRRYDSEVDIYHVERDHYETARAAYRDGYRQGAGRPRYPDERDERGYDAARDYRAGPGYQEHALAPDERVYRGYDGNYYCKRSDGTTGLIVGAAGGGILGNVIDGGRSRTAGTLIGGALGALAGRALDQQQSTIRCR